MGLLDYVKLRRAIILVAHIVLIILAYALAFILRFEWQIPPPYLSLFVNTLALIVIVKGMVFYLFGLYQGIWRYVSMEDLLNILKATIVSSALFASGIIIFYGHGFPRSVLVLDWTFCFLFLCGIRLSIRIARERFYFLEKIFPTTPHPQRGYPNRLSLSKSQNLKRRLLIVGAGQAGVILKSEIQSNPKLNYEILGFVDDDRVKIGARVQGIKVFGPINQIPDIVKHYNVDEVIIAIPSANGEQMRRIYNICNKTKIKPKSLPPLNQILEGELVRQIKDIEPEDLILREKVELDKDVIYKEISGKPVLITGAGGTIGKELVLQLGHFSPSHIVLLDQVANETYITANCISNRFPDIKTTVCAANILDKDKIRRIISEYRPQIIYHAAAQKHVPLMEEDPAEAVIDNVVGTKRLMEVAIKEKVPKVILISTDKAVNPTSVMGATKRVCELMFLGLKDFKDSNTSFISVRFGNVIGSSGSLIPILKEEIKRGGPITITHPDMERYFMSISEAVQLVLQASAIGKGGELFVLDMGKRVRIMDVINKFLELSGLKKDEIEIKVIGMRPGEKIKEELWSERDEIMPTSHPKLFSIKSNCAFAYDLWEKIGELERFAHANNVPAIIYKLKEMVPEYTPSEYVRKKWLSP